MLVRNVERPDIATKIYLCLRINLRRRRVMWILDENSSLNLSSMDSNVNIVQDDDMS